MAIVVPIVLGIAGFAVGMVGGYSLYEMFSQFSQQTRMKLRNAKQEAKKKGDPKYFQEQVSQIQKQFLAGLQKFDLQKGFQKLDNKKDIMFIGQTSVGKSSLINHLFKTQIKTGVGQTTENTSKVYEDVKMRVYDSVGQNYSFQFYQQDKLIFVNQMNVIFILYAASPKSIQNMINVICWQRATYKIIFIRCKCDLFSVTDNKTVDEEIQTDKQIIKSFGVKDPIILKTSIKLPDSYENHKIKQFL